MNTSWHLHKRKTITKPLNAVVTEYEEKLSYTLIHQCPEFKTEWRAQQSAVCNENTFEQIRELSLNIEAKSNEIRALELKLKHWAATSKRTQ